MQTHNYKAFTTIQTYGAMLPVDLVQPFLRSWQNVLPYQVRLDVHQRGAELQISAVYAIQVSPDKLWIY